MLSNWECRADAQIILSYYEISYHLNHAWESSNIASDSTFCAWFSSCTSHLIIPITNPAFMSFCGVSLSLYFSESFTWGHLTWIYAFILICLKLIWNHKSTHQFPWLPNAKSCSQLQNLNHFVPNRPACPLCHCHCCFSSPWHGKNTFSFHLQSPIHF